MCVKRTSMNIIKDLKLAFKLGSLSGQKYKINGYPTKAKKTKNINDSRQIVKVLSPVIFEEMPIVKHKLLQRETEKPVKSQSERSSIITLSCKSP